MRRFFLGFFCLFLPLSSVAWNTLGHMVVATIAYQSLEPNVRDQVNNLITYFQKEYPEMNSFVAISYWPDTLHSQQIENYSRWHYIDVPFSTDGTPLQDTIDTDNAVWAVNDSEVIVKNTKANVYERVRFLSFLVHIVGDLHQPLHTVTYFSTNHPEGDKGGNLYAIQYKSGTTTINNLHKLWDMGVDTFNTEATTTNASTLATTIMKVYPSSYFGDKVNDLNPDDWAEEGLSNAKQFAYTTPENKTPSADYINTGKQIAQQEAALAGYRLATLLNQLMG